VWPLTGSTARPVKEIGMGLFGNKATCLTCNEVASDPGKHVLDKHLQRVEGHFTYDCPCGQSAGRWASLESALAARMGHMKESHRDSKVPVRVLNGFR
jgi:hypothetical protein